MFTTHRSSEDAVPLDKMSKFTYLIVLMAVVAIVAARPQGVNVVDSDSQVSVVDSESQVNVVDSNGQVNVVDSDSQVNVVDSDSQVHVVH